MGLKTCKFRIYPTKIQTEKLEETRRRCCELYNAGLQERRDAYRMCKKSICFEEQSAQLPDIKELRPEYHEIHSQVLQDVLHRLDKAFKAFFKRIKEGQTPGYPRFQSHTRFDSFTYAQSGYAITGKKITLSKIGNVRIKVHRPVQGKTKTCTVKREGDCWYVCLACEVGDCPRTPYTDEAVGIDLGLCTFAALSTGDMIDNPRFYRKAEAQLQAIQQELSRKKRGSHRRKKTVARLAKAHRTVRNQRQDYLHKHSRWLVDTYETIVFEDLSPGKMSRAPKAKKDEGTGAYLPNGASQKAGMNKSIQDVGWTTFVTMCESKAACAGSVQVKKVDAYKTSQLCSGCRKEGPHKDLSERVHTCIHCGLVLDRDTNAAKVILAVWQEGLQLRPIKKSRPGRGRQGNPPLGSPRL